MPRLNPTSGSGSGGYRGSPTPVREGTRRVEPPATGGGEPAQRYSDAKNDYVLEDRATGDSQQYGSNPRNIRNPQFQIFLDTPGNEDKPRTSSRGGQAAASAAYQLRLNSSLHDSPPPGFQYKPWMNKHPQVALAGMRSNLTSDDWGILDRHFRTEDATVSLMIAAQISTVNPDQLAITYAGLAPDVRDGALKNLQDLANSQQNTNPTDPYNADAQSKGYLQQLWDDHVWPVAEGVGRGVGWAYDNWSHLVRTDYLQFRNDLSQEDTSTGNADQQFSEAWANTEDHALDPKVISDLVAKHGEKPTKMLLDINRAFSEHPNDPWTELLTKYGNDPEFFPMMNKYMLADQRDSNYNDLQNGIELASNGTLGNMVVRDLPNSKNLDPQIRKVLATGTDIAATLLLDPTIAASKVAAAVKIAKYGLVAMASAEKGATAVARIGVTVDRMMTYRSVRKFWADMGADAKAYVQAKSVGDNRLADSLMTRMREREDRIWGHRERGLETSFTPKVEDRYQVALRMGHGVGDKTPQRIGGFELGQAPRQTTLRQEIIDNKLFTPEEAADWIKSGEGLDLILRGHSAMKYPLMPRYTWGSEALRMIMPASRGIADPKIYVSAKRGPGWLRTGINAGHVLFETNGNPADLAKNLEANAEDIAKTVGLTGEYKKVPLGNGNVRIPVGVHLWGESRQRGLVYAMRQADRSLEGRARRVRNWLKSAPIKKTIYISDGRDAKAIGSLGRAMGFRKEHVDTLMNIWVDATTAQRRMIAQGLAKTFLHAHGIDANDPEALKHFGMQLVDGINPQTQYATRIPWADVSMSDEQARSILTGQRLSLQGGDMTLDQRQRYLSDLMFHQANAARKAYFELKRLRQEISTTKGLAKKSPRFIDLQDKAEDLRNVINQTTSDLLDVIRNNGEDGINLARELGLEITDRGLEISLNAAKETGAAIRDIGKANTAARNAVDQAARTARNSANRTRDIPTVQATRSVIRENADQHAEVKSYIDDAKQVNNQLPIDAQAAARQSRADIRAASDLHHDLMFDTIDEAKNVRSELRTVQKELKDLSGSGRGMKRQELLDLEYKLQARLDMLEDAASHMYWRFQNLKTEEEYTRRLKASTTDFSTYDPSLIDGISHALHVRQTANRIRMPDFEKIQQMAGRTGLMDAMLGMTFSNWATNVVDTWSLITLAGFRFALRNGIEDFIFHDLSGGDIGTTVKGRRASNAYLVASGKRSTFMHDLVHAKWRPYVTKDEIKQAIQARREGDRQAFADLVARGMIRGKLSTLGFFPDAVAAEHIDQLIKSGYADTMLSEIAESAVNIEKNSGRSIGDYYDRLSDSAPIGAFDSTKFQGAGTRPVFRNVPLTDQRGYDAWWTAINDFAHGDGELGRAALWEVWHLSGQPAGSARILAQQAAAKRLAELVDNGADVPWAYKNIFSGVEAAGSENFASRYLQEALTVFSGEEGINRALVAKLIGKKPETGYAGIVNYVDDPSKKGTALWDLVNGVKEYRVTPNDLHNTKEGMVGQMGFRPTAVVGRTDGMMVPDVSNWQNFSSRLWSLMGDQYNRIARQPMFFANYLQQRTLLKEYEQMLTEKFGAEAAQSATSKLAADRAYEKLMAFTDNPGNRTLLAWNTRNLARYYRATEDFYRRSVRAARFYPERVVRDALLLHAVNDAGFVHTDDQGNKYFMYPNVFPAFNSLMKLIDVPLSVPTGNAGFKGQFNMLTPSADPAAWLPTLSSPLIAAPIAAITAKWEPFGNIQRVLMGEQSMGRSAMDMILPPAIVSIFDIKNQDENNGRFANNLRNVIYGFAAHGNIPDPNASQDEIDNWTADAKMQAESLTILQAIMRTFVPASPNTVADAPTSDQFAASGVGTLRQSFLDLVKGYANNGSKDPFKDAVAAWWKINPNLSFWEVPKSKDRSTAFTLTTDDGANWIRQNADIVKSHPEAVGYLIPKSGQYTPQALREYKAYGIRIPDELNHFATRVAVSKQLNTYYMVRDNYRQARAAESNPDKQKEMDKQFSDWKNGWTDDNGVHHQGFMDTLPGYQNNTLLQLFLRTSDAPEIKKKTLSELSNTDPNKPGVLQIIKNTRPEQWDADPTLQKMQDMIMVYTDAKQAIDRANGNTKEDRAKKLDVKTKFAAWAENFVGNDQRLLELYRSLMEPDFNVDGGQ